MCVQILISREISHGMCAISVNQVENWFLKHHDSDTQTIGDANLFIKAVNPPKIFWYSSVCFFFRTEKLHSKIKY